MNINYSSALVGYNITGGSTVVPDDVAEQLKDILEKVTELETQFSSLKLKQKSIAMTGEERMINVTVVKESQAVTKDGTSTIESAAATDGQGTHSCDCSQTNDQCCKTNNYDQNSSHGNHSKDKCHEKSDVAIRDKVRDIPEDLSVEYLREYKAIKEQFEVIHSKSTEIFDGINFTC